MYSWCWRNQNDVWYRSAGANPFLTPLYYMTSRCYHDITVSNPRAEQDISFLAKESPSIHCNFHRNETRTYVITGKCKNLVQWVQMLGFYKLIYSSFHCIVCFNQPCSIGTKSFASKKNKIGFRKSFHLSIVSLFIFSFSFLYSVLQDNIFSFLYCE